jgi:CHASE3 domain sensor protein
MIKIVEDTMIRRIDRKVFNSDNPNLKNTLKDLKILDNSALLVELKDPTELQQDLAHGDDGEVITLNKVSAPSKDDEEMVDIDSTENIRTVIVNMDSDKNTFDRYQINIDWTLQELTEYIIKEKQLEPPYKIRNLTT